MKKTILFFFYAFVILLTCFENKTIASRLIIDPEAPLTSSSQRGVTVSNSINEDPVELSTFSNSMNEPRRSGLKNPVMAFFIMTDFCLAAAVLGNTASPKQFLEQAVCFISIFEIIMLCVSQDEIRFIFNDSNIQNMALLFTVGRFLFNTLTFTYEVMSVSGNELWRGSDLIVVWGCLPFAISIGLVIADSCFKPRIPTPSPMQRLRQVEVRSLNTDTVQPVSQVEDKNHPPFYFSWM